MKQSIRVGFWSVVVGTFLFVGAAATKPAGGCIPAVGRDHSAHVGVMSVSTIQYTFAGNTCYLDTTYLLGFVGFFLAVFGALLWSSSKLVDESTIDPETTNSSR